MKSTINKLKSSFRRLGIDIEEGKSGNRFYSIAKVENTASISTDENAHKLSNSAASSDFYENNSWTDTCVRTGIFATVCPACSTLITTTG
jgi:hypothetical protein